MTMPTNKKVPKRRILGEFALLPRGYRTIKLLQDDKPRTRIESEVASRRAEH